jgi:phospholipase C
VGRWFTRARPVTPKQQAEADAVAPVVMHAFAPEKVPVISTLATEFALCQRWFCSVPGETWPNRNFFHAGHSSGSVDIELGFYRDRTIFQILDEAKKTWRVYYGQFPPQVFFFPYVLEHSIHGSGSLQNLFTDIEQSSLANYTFVEPHHGLLHQRPSCSQHPSNNLKGKDDGSDFRAGERLIAEIYQRLAANPELFTKTLLVVTYDEHGGLYDHRRPPPAITAGDRQDTWSRRIVRWLEARHFPMRFDFRRLGPRVPCLVISPWIPAATLDCRVHDHTSLPRTLRKLFAPHARFLSLRERRAPTIETLLTLPRPRTRAGGPAPTTDPSDRPLPDLSAAMQQLADPPLFAAAAAEAPAQRPAVNFEWELLALTDAIRRKTVPPPGTPLAVKHPSRRQAGLLRLRRLRAKSTKELAQLYTDTQFTLGVMAAEQTEH